MKTLLKWLVIIALVAVIRRLVVGDRLGRGGWKSWSGRASGFVYRLTGRHPDTDVDDLTLADRVRSTLGPLEHQLDIPRVHVMVENGTVLLHGDVASGDDADLIEDEVRSVWGVTGVDSHLHIGLLASDTRPSVGELGELREFLAAVEA